ncbi:hypothetical protein Afil01_51280 [Actinorhabdospora filicis]|uniref:NACHT domain-containing protein n=1 Tax=Actinorhabdospora filicis TaxID=1785913 RepID=A0A9W6ST82_9ACTN|nr:hypothetical protein [Actinorhabdospora filicis]GLZ80321.1 hypothetical protein Afil01_51280 [Actinorhabdospora filicis]
MGDVIPELEPLAHWFAGALEREGYDGVGQFVASTEYFTMMRAKIYRLHAAEGTVDLELIRMIGLTLDDRETGEWLWRRAAEAIQLAAAKEAREASRIDSWHLIPQILDPDVERLLQAQRQEARLLPYRELAVNAPALTTIYVRQRVQARMEAPPPQDRPKRFREKKPVAATVENTSAFDALNRSTHLLLTGEAGSGKTTFSYYTTELLSRIWLGDLSPRDCAVRTPVMPLRVLARHLTGGRPWDEELAEAVRKTLGSRLMSSFSPELLRGRVHGVRWLVFVDGLDEITDAEARRELIGTLAHHARVSEQYRFVIGTRMLESAELAPLRGESVGAYEMVPFRREDLETFAANWFGAQNLSHSQDHWKAHADRYLHQVQDSRLRELVRNPLLATIAAVVSTRDPGRALPTNRLDLYRTVVRYLIDDDYSGRRSEARGELDVWLHEQRAHLIERLGRARIQDEPLLASAAEWIAENWTGSGHREVYEKAARRQLTATGLFVQDDEDVRFLHHSFAEYLSGLGFAAAIGPDPEAVTAWVRENKDRDDNLLLFTVLSWHRLHGGDLRSLLLADERRRLAVQLIGEGLDLGEEVTGAVIDKAVRHALTEDVVFFDVLGGLYGNQIAARRLRRLADHGELPVDRRVQALLALGRITDFGSVATELTGLLPHAPIAVRVPIAKAMAEDLPGRDIARALRLLEECVDQAIAEHDEATMCAALQQMCDLGATEDADRLLDAVMAVIGPTTSYLEELAVITVRLRGRAGLEPLLERPAEPGARTYLAIGLNEAGHHDLAERVAEGVAADPAASSDEVGAACRAWSAAGGDPDAIVRAATARDSMSVQTLLSIATALHRAGASRQAAGLISGLLAVDSTPPATVAEAAGLWSQIDEEGPAVFGRLLARHPENAELLAALAEAALAQGRAELAADLARRAVVGAGPEPFIDALETLINAGAPDEAIDLARERWESLSDDSRLRLASALITADPDLAHAIASSISGPADDIHNRVANLVAQGLPLSRLTPALRRRAVLGSTFIWWDDTVTSEGATHLPEALADPQIEYDQPNMAVRRYLKADLRDPAIAALREYLTSNELTPEARARVAAVLAHLSFARPGTKTCGVPGCPGDPAVPTSQEG